jgi:hypothetical protein
MFARRIFQVAVAGAVLAAGYAVPAAAAVRYDPAAKSGFAAAADVRQAFGWTRQVLAARATGLVFSHDFWTRDTYSVWCGKGPFPIAHEREFGRFELTDVVVHESRRGVPAGYGRRPELAGFKIIGPYAGISGTSVAPAAGQPCPADRGPRVTRAELISTTTGWTLSVSSGGGHRVLRTGR